MTIFFDPITQERCRVNKATQFYFIRLTDDRYCLKAIANDFYRLTYDPATGSDDYWPINSEPLTHNKRLKALFFPDNRLTNQAFSAQEIKCYLNIDLNNAASKHFISKPRKDNNDRAMNSISLIANPPSPSQGINSFTIRNSSLSGKPTISRRKINLNTSPIKPNEFSGTLFNNRALYRGELSPEHSIGDPLKKPQSFFLI